MGYIKALWVVEVVGLFERGDEYADDQNNQRDNEDLAVTADICRQRNNTQQRHDDNYGYETGNHDITKAYWR